MGLATMLDNAAAAITGRYGRQRPSPPAEMTQAQATAVLFDTSRWSDDAVNHAHATIAKFKRDRPEKHERCAVCGAVNAWVECETSTGDVWACRACKAHAPASLYPESRRPAWAWDEDEIADAKEAREAREAEKAAAKVVVPPTTTALRAAHGEALAALMEAQVEADAAKAVTALASAAYYDADEAADEAKAARRRGDDDAPGPEVIPGLVAEEEKLWAVYRDAQAKETAAAARVRDVSVTVRQAALAVLGAEDGAALAARAAAAMSDYAAAVHGLVWLRTTGCWLEAPTVGPVLSAWETKPSSWVVPGGVPDSGLAAKLAALVDPKAGVVPAPTTGNGKGVGR